MDYYITSLRLRSLIGQLSFFLIPNIVLGKMKIQEHPISNRANIRGLHVSTPYELLVKPIAFVPFSFVSSSSLLIKLPIGHLKILRETGSRLS